MVLEKKGFFTVLLPPLLSGTEMLNGSFSICFKTALSCLHTQRCLNGREINLKSV